MWQPKIGDKTKTMIKRLVKKIEFRKNISL